MTSWPRALCQICGSPASEPFAYRPRLGLPLLKHQQTPFSACLKVMCETEKVLSLILKAEENGR